MCYYATYSEIAIIPSKPAIKYWADDVITGIHFVYNIFYLIRCLNEIGMAVFVTTMDKVHSLRRYKSQSVFLYDSVMRQVTRCTLVESRECLRRGKKFERFRPLL